MQVIKSIAIAFVTAAALSLFSAQPATAAKCTKEYAPVCAVKGGVRATYGNACQARAVKARILHAGACVATGPICILPWIPVCALDPASGKPRTFSSLCWAELANATLLYNGVCK